VFTEVDEGDFLLQAELAEFGSDFVSGEDAVDGLAGGFGDGNCGFSGDGVVLPYL
jgi:hypothetical protein